MKRIGEDFEDSAWSVKNNATGQVFGPYPGKTPMDAKKHLLATQPGLAGIHPADLSAYPFGTEDPSSANHSRPSTQEPPSPVPPNGSPRRFPRAQRQAMAIGPDVPDRRSEPTAAYRRQDPSRPRPGFTGGSDDPRERDTHAYGKGMRGEGMGAIGMGANGPMGRDPEKEAFKEAVRAMVREIVRKKEGGGGYRLYPPNKGKKKKDQKPVGEFPTRFSAKKAELARFPPKDPEQLKKMRARIDKLSKDPRKRADAERRDLTGEKRPRKSGAPARERKRRKEEFIRLMAQDLHERLFHDEEVPGSPWDEQMTSLHPDAISSDRKLHALHKGMERASIGALGDAHKGLARALRGIVKVNPGDIAFDDERKQNCMPVMLDCDGYEIGPVHLYIDGGHVKIELSKDARQAIAQLEPNTARDLRGGLMSFEEDHLPKIDGAQRAWRDRDSYLDRLHGKLSKHAAGLSGVEHHILKGLLTKGGKRK